MQSVFGWLIVRAGWLKQVERTISVVLIAASVFAPWIAFAQGRPDIVWMGSGHTKGVSSVAFSPDGRLVASGSLDDTIKLWRVSDGQLVRTLTGHSVSSVAFSPDGQLLASGSVDRTVRLWRVSDGQLRQVYDQETGSVFVLVGGVLSIQFSPSGEFFAYGRNDATVVLARNPLGKGSP